MARRRRRARHSLRESWPATDISLRARCAQLYTIAIHGTLSLSYSLRCIGEEWKFWFSLFVPLYIRWRFFLLFFFCWLDIPISIIDTSRSVNLWILLLSPRFCCCEASRFLVLFFLLCGRNNNNKSNHSWRRLKEWRFKVWRKHKRLSIFPFYKFLNSSIERYKIRSSAQNSTGFWLVLFLFKVPTI